MFTGMNIDQLNKQFLNYQLISEADIPKEVKEQANLAEDDPYHINSVGIFTWFEKPVTNSLEFDLLFKVAEAVLKIPHFNAGEERIFH